MKVLVVYVASIILAGCATHAQRQYQELEKQFLVALASMNTCSQPLLQTPVFQRLRERFVIDINDPRTVQKSALRDYVTEQEAQDILELSVLRKPCHKVALEESSKVHPEYVASLARMFAEADGDLAKAINKELTVGDVNRRTLERFNRWVAELQQIGRRIVSQMNQAHQYELIQRELAAQALLTLGYPQQLLYNQQQLINDARRPLTMNCRYIGNTVHCTEF